MSFLVPVDKFKTRSTAADVNNFKLKKKEDFLIKWSAGLERDQKKLLTHYLGLVTDFKRHQEV